MSLEIKPRLRLRCCCTMRLDNEQVFHPRGREAVAIVCDSVVAGRMMARAKRAREEANADEDDEGSNIDEAEVAIVTCTALQQIPFLPVCGAKHYHMGM